MCNNFCYNEPNSPGICFPFGLIHSIRLFEFVCGEMISNKMRKLDSDEFCHKIIDKNFEWRKK